MDIISLVAHTWTHDTGTTRHDTDMPATQFFQKIGHGPGHGHVDLNVSKLYNIHILYLCFYNF